MTTVIEEHQKPDISRNINSAIWTQVEDYYKMKIDEIHIPEDPKPFDITSINAKLEQLYHEARLDQYYVTSSFERVHQSYKMLKRALFPLVKDGKNAEARDHLLQKHLLETPLDQLDQNLLNSLGLPSAPVSVFTVYDTYKERMDYMKTVMDIIMDKSNRLITDSGAMKIESRFGN